MNQSVYILTLGPQARKRLANGGAVTIRSKFVVHNRSFVLIFFRLQADRALDDCHRGMEEDLSTLKLLKEATSEQRKAKLIKRIMLATSGD